MSLENLFSLDMKIHRLQRTCYLYELFLTCQREGIFIYLSLQCLFRLRRKLQKATPLCVDGVMTFCQQDYAKCWPPSQHPLIALLMMSPKHNHRRRRHHCLCHCQRVLHLSVAAEASDPQTPVPQSTPPTKKTIQKPIPFRNSCSFVGVRIIFKQTFAVASVLVLPSLWHYWLFVRVVSAAPVKCLLLFVCCSVCFCCCRLAVRVGSQDVNNFACHSLKNASFLAEQRRVPHLLLFFLMLLFLATLMKLAI